MKFHSIFHNVLKALHFTTCFGLLAFVFLGCKADDTATPAGKIQLTAARVGSYPLNLTDYTQNTLAPSDRQISLDFSAGIDSVSAKSTIQLLDGLGAPVSVRFGFLDNSRTVSMQPLQALINAKPYSINIGSQLLGLNKETIAGINLNFTVAPATLKLDSFTVDGKKGGGTNRMTEIGYRPQINVWMSDAIEETSVNSNTVVLTSKTGPIAYSFSLSADKKKLTVIPNADLKSFSRFTFQINSGLRGTKGQVFGGLNQYFYTKLDMSDKFPVISDEELITLVQKQTFKYFWDFAHPVSGLALERDQTPEVVTIGGSGFGIMAIIVGVERGFITRSQAVDRWTKIMNFLKKADRFHGAWPHWMNGSTGKTIPFSPDDDGGDLVESSFMIHGLITVKQYLNAANPTENQLKLKIDSLCNAVEWDWYRRGNQNVLYWHWSPRVGWKMNFPLRGWNETLIPYVLAASSTTHTIPKVVYTSGFTTGNEYTNGHSYYGIPLPLGPAYGGPLFFSHYSFLGLKPTQLSDAYANYNTQTVNHSKINYAYCVANPKKFIGYSADCWGLTASDNQDGYNAHSPTNDLGVITPTAALSSFPYTPTESMRALKFFYYKLGDRTWGQYGFYDAFNPTEDWYGRTFLAIDQGPIVVMMENYRTGLLWNLFMSAPEVQLGLTKLGFQY